MRREDNYVIKDGDGDYFSVCLCCNSVKWRDRQKDATRMQAIEAMRLRAVLTYCDTRAHTMGHHLVEITKAKVSG